MEKSPMLHEKLSGTMPQRPLCFTNGHFILRTRWWSKMEACRGRSSTSIGKGKLNLAHVQNQGMTVETTAQTLWSTPTQLCPDVLQMRTELSRGILSECYQGSEAFCSSILTGDNTWLSLYDPEDKAQTKQRLSRVHTVQTKQNWASQEQTSW